MAQKLPNYSAPLTPVQAELDRVMNQGMDALRLQMYALPAGWRWAVDVKVQNMQAVFTATPVKV